MPLQPANDSTARSGADAIRLAFDAYQREFRQITRRARSRFEGQDWRGMQQDARERLDLYPRVITDVVADVRRILGERAQDRSLWPRMRAAYSGAIAGRPPFQLA